MKKLRVIPISFLLMFCILSHNVFAAELEQVFTFSEKQVEFQTKGEFDYIKLNSLESIIPEDTPGAPCLPAVYVNILLPSGAEDISVEVVGEEHLLKTNVIVYPSQVSQPRNQPVGPFIEPLDSFYNQSEMYPLKRSGFSGIHTMRGYTYATFRLNPVRYRPSEKEVYLTTSMRLKITYELPEIRKTGTLYPKSTLFNRILGRMVVNPEDINTPEMTSGDTPTADEVKYLVITNDALKDAFQELATYRSVKYSTEVVTTEFIQINYTGRDTQEKIRNAIKTYVTDNQTEFVVLGGDETVIPDRDCPTRNITDMPTDLYYSGLDSNWDEDNDDIFCEFDYSGTDDEGDLAFDVIVGRIPVQTPSDALAYINKLKHFESTVSDTIERKILMAGAELAANYEGDARPSDLLNDDHLQFRDHETVSDAEMYNRRNFRDDIRKYWVPDSLGLFFDTLTSWDTNGGSVNYVQNPENLSEKMNEGWFYMFMDTHGNRTIWGLDEGQFSTSDASALTGIVGHIYTNACLTGYFDHTGTALSEAFIRNGSGGAISYMGCSREGFFIPDYGSAEPQNTGGVSATFTQKFQEIVFTTGTPEMTIGQAFAEHKALLIGPSLNDQGYRWVQFGLNLQGDPAALVIPSGANGIPVADDASVSVKEHQFVEITLTGSDPDGDPLTYTITANPENGILTETVNPEDGILTETVPDITYTPTAGYYGPDSFKFTVNDGIIDSPEATITIDVIEVNYLPWANPRAYFIDEDTSVNITLTGSDLDEDPFTYILITSPQYGTLSGTIPNLIYTPNAGFTGIDSFMFVTNDGRVDSQETKITINVEIPNIAPVADDKSVTTNQGTVIGILLTGSDSDDNSLSFRIRSAPSHGKIHGSVPNITYIPEEGFSGEDSFTYVANDGKTNSPEATVTIAVLPSNELPVADSKSISTTPDIPVEIMLTGSDPEGNALIFTITTDPENGTLNGIAPELTYTPNTGFSGDDSFEYIVNDGQVDSTPAITRINIRSQAGVVQESKQNQDSGCFINSIK